MGDVDEDHPLFGIFSQLDVDGDGYLSHDDLTEALQGLGLGISVDEIFEKLDPNDNGVIDFDQFIDGASLFTGGGAEDIEADGDDDAVEEVDDATENMASIFRLVDTDGDGSITFGQLGDAVSHVIGRVLSSSEMGQLKQAFGEGADDGISMETFVSVMQQFTGAGDQEDSDDDEFEEDLNAMYTPDERLSRARAQSRLQFSSDDISNALDQENFAEVLAESKSIKKKNKDLR